MWNYAHVGNFRAFLFFDLLRRHLQVSGYQVVHVMNITDVDDRIIDQADAAGITIGQFTERYEKAFFEDLAGLRAQPVEIYPRATAHVGEMVALIERLLAEGKAYEAQGDVYWVEPNKVQVVIGLSCNWWQCRDCTALSPVRVLNRCASCGGSATPAKSTASRPCLISHTPLPTPHGSDIAFVVVKHFRTGWACVNSSSF